MQLGLQQILVAIVFGLLITIIHPVYASDNRIALVIGNSTYPSSPLRNPANDAIDVSATLLQLDFEVIHLENATFLEMEKQYASLVGNSKNRMVLEYFSTPGMGCK